MMNLEFLRSLTCPYCRGPVGLSSGTPDSAGAIDHGVATCPCYEYPIVDGILVLRQLSEPFDTAEPAVDRLRVGDVDGARERLMSAASMVADASAAPSLLQPGGLRALASDVRQLSLSAVRKAARRGRSTTPATTVRASLERLRPEGYARYLYQRYANPSFVASVPTMALLELVERSSSGRARPYVLDLACGVGHSTAMMRALFPDMVYVAADPDFVNLHILQRHFVEDAICVCMDAEFPLPFKDDQFDAVFCLDAFHYIRAKWALAQELDRVVEADGVWILPHLHNAAVPNPSPGIPLEAADYLRVFGFLEPVLADEQRILDRFMVDHVLEVVPTPSHSELSGAAVYSMCGRRQAPPTGTFDIGARMLALVDDGALGVNPVYRITAQEDVVVLTIEWPDQGLERECAAIESYLPNRVEIRRETWEQLHDNRLDSTSAAEIADLVRSFVVLVGLPAGYRRDAFEPHSALLDVPETFS